MNFNKFDLPIVDVIPEIQSKLSTNNTLILNAPPGAGKSTLLPLALYQENWLKGQKIIMLEPRRLAAKTIANRLSELLGETVGNTVGYRIRFDTKVSESTKIEIVTEGILTRMLQSDNALENVGMVIFDEYHERSIHADLALALCRETQSILREELRILIMSATLNMPELVELLNAPTVVSEGRQYPVETFYEDLSDEYMMAETTAQVIVKALKTRKGDVLAFLPGQREIAKCAEIVKKQFTDIEIHELFGRLSHSKQQLAINPSKNGNRKVVIATDIAETSLTIKGVTIVVDSGFARVSKFDPKTGLSGLHTVHISKDSAEQRKGRAGRLEAGTCYRLWTKGKHAQLPEHKTPEIVEADLTSLVLDLAKWGILNPNDLIWLTPPPSHSIKQAVHILHSLNALENNKITKHGEIIQRIPCHPRIAHMLIMAKKQSLGCLATDIAAVIEEKDPLPKGTSVDINLRIEALRRYRKNNKQNKSFGFSKIEKIASQYRKMRNLEINNSEINPYETGLLLVYAYPERIAFARPGNNAQFQLANGKYASLNHRDDLAYEPWLSVAHLNASGKTGRIFMASPLNPKDLKSFVAEIETNTWHTKKGGVISKLELRIGSIILKSTPLPNPDKNQIINAICNAIKKEGEHLLKFDNTVKQFQNRVLTLNQLNPSQNWPNMSTQNLILNVNDWLPPYLNDIKTPEDLKRINLKEVLEHSLTYEQQKLLNLLAPTHIKAPSGSNIKLDYQANASAPILAVRIQEVFGLKQSPTINNGKTDVLLHLLSPAFKPVQITSDLNNFWENTYFEVRKELRGRYKKHAWPEDPKNHIAIKGTKRQNGI